MALIINEVAPMRVGWRMPKMHESGIVKRGFRLKARDMPTEFRRCLVGTQHDRSCIPSDQRTNLVLDHPVARMNRLFVRRDGVDVSAVGGKRQLGAISPCRIDRTAQNEVGSIGSFECSNALDRFDPFPHLDCAIV
jgi:hypothetical protein